MPWDRKLYPKDWDDIALRIKNAADWKCQDCQRPCRRPGESEEDFAARMAYSEWESELYREEWDEEHGVVEALVLGRFVLTVAHLNHEPSDCRSENLRALCAPCHCRMDLRAMSTKKRLKQERNGQLTLTLGD